MTDWTLLANAYATLTALRSNLAESNDIDAAYVTEYEAVLDRLERAGFVVSEFRIPADTAKPRVTAVTLSTRRRPGKVQYSEETFVPGKMFRIKLDAILTLFTLHKERPAIGFNAPLRPTDTQ
jgi:hypothetical protein